MLQRMKRVVMKMNPFSVDTYQEGQEGQECPSTVVLVSVREEYYIQLHIGCEEMYGREEVVFGRGLPTHVVYCSEVRCRANMM